MRLLVKAITATFLINSRHAILDYQQPKLYGSAGGYF